MIKKIINLKKLDKLERLYGYLLTTGNGAYYWHYSLDYELIKKELIQ